MNSMGVRAALAFLLLFIATVKAATTNQGGVTFWKEDFTMTCPEKGTWFKKAEVGNLSQTYTSPYTGKSKGVYYCSYKDKDSKDIKYYFYLKGRVCANCFELDAAFIAVIIVVNMVGTTCVMLIIYRCTKKRREAGLTPDPKAPALPGGRPPVLYEPLNPHTRSQDPYSVVNRMG
ncbi:T-cell surface glycoprotein CD3 epsilon chain-like [Cebidichthys violaceus]|uniref:T-cell surface glycoprotein CD3 epsilon chain-like n=1 Tax=Cebidichthys violaceus TaxID=271503 RepID=UPI0035CA573B